MNRNRFLVAILALGGLATAAEVRSTLAAQQQRVQEFQAKAQQARKEQKLEGDRKALVTKYPTPELGFFQPVEARGGSEVTLSVPGRYLPESLVVVPCEGVEVLSTKVTAERAEARVRILPNTLSARCDLQVVSPVSAISRSKPALLIKADVVWELTLANGMTTRWTLEPSADGTTFLGQSEWFEKGKPLGARPVTLVLSGEQARAVVGSSEAETRAIAQNAGANRAGMETLAKKMDALVKTMQTECKAATGDKRRQCVAKYQPQMDALNKELEAGPQAAQGTAGSGSAVCTELTLKAVGGKVTGTANSCAGKNGVQVSGTYKPGSGK